MLARALLLVLTCLVAVACGGSSATPSRSVAPGSPSASAGVSASPVSSGPTVDETFCGTIAELESALASFEAIKIKASNANKLKDAANGVSAALAPITNTATADLKNLTSAMKTAVDGLSSSTENYATTSPSGLAAAEKKLKKSLTTLHTAITQLRQAATCSN